MLPEEHPSDVEETPEDGQERTPGAETWRRRALVLAQAGVEDAEIEAALRHEARGKWPMTQVRLGFARWKRQGWLDDARAAGAVELTEALRATALGDGREAATAAIYLAKREESIANMDPELRRLLKELSGLSGEELKKRAREALGKLEEA